jgi:hypothetical protein
MSVLDHAYSSDYPSKSGTSASIHHTGYDDSANSFGIVIVSSFVPKNCGHLGRRGGASGASRLR